MSKQRAVPLALLTFILGIVVGAYLGRASINCGSASEVVSPVVPAVEYYYGRYYDLPYNTKRKGPEDDVLLEADHRLHSPEADLHPVHDSGQSRIQAGAPREGGEKVEKAFCERSKGEPPKPKQ
ncbi:hypothetical protein BSKO_07940 [Bryopsis sp. KO-2023]|nr:hypothetical protein BSKO_07940 [Bryopsis sp. KO-2023]